MFPVPLHPGITQLRKVLQRIFHIPLSPICIPPAYSNLYASALEFICPDWGWALVQ
jgi:hypothetical protein